MAPGFSARNPQLSISTETRLKLYRTMLECRVLEKRAYDLFMQNLIKGTSHLALGQEAIAAGFGLAMRPTTTRSARTAATTTRSSAASG